MAVSIILFFVFISFELKINAPILNISIFRHNPTFTFSNLAALINYSATFSVGFLMSLYLQYIKGFTPQHAGLIMIAQPIVMAITSPIAGKFSDKIEPRAIASTGMGFTALGIFLLIFLDASSSILHVIYPLLILGLGFGLFTSPNTNAIMSSVDKKYLGIASSTVGTMRLIGQMISMGIIMTIFSLILGQVKITPEQFVNFEKAVKISFCISAALCFLGIFASLKRGKLRS
jgi:MFS family permease